MEQLRGDRDGGLDPLHGRQWDAVLDTSGYIPRIVRAGAELLAGSVAHYTFVSSISVFRDFATPDQDEDAPLGALADPTTETVDGATYGPLKVLCEQAVQSAFPARSLIVRPGLIVGPHDPTDRFTYWPWRLAGRPAGDSLPVPGDVLAPGDPAAAVQFVDARDLAGWMVRLIEARVGGVFNATGPESPQRVYTMGELLHTCRQVAASEASRSGELIWADEGFLLRAEVKPWTELPLWVPSSDPRMAHMQRVDCSRARAAGLTFRPVAEHGAGHPGLGPYPPRRVTPGGPGSPPGGRRRCSVSGGRSRPARPRERRRERPLARRRALRGLALPDHGRRRGRGRRPPGPPGRGWPRPLLD